MSTRPILLVALALTSEVAAAPQLAITRDPDVGLASLEARIALFATRVDGVVAVTITRADRSYVVVVDRPGRASVRFLVDADLSDTDAERVIALKIAGLDDTPPPRAPSATAPATDWRAGGGLAMALARSDREIAAGPAVVGERRWLRGVDLGARLSARWLFAGAIDRPEARTSIHEGTLAVSGSIGIGRFALRGGLAATVLRAAMETADGRRGSGWQVVPVASVGVGVGFGIGAGELLVGLDLERGLVQQRYVLDGMVVADLGTNRASFHVTWLLPIWP